MPYERRRRRTPTPDRARQRRYSSEDRRDRDRRDRNRDRDRDWDRDRRAGRGDDRPLRRGDSRERREARDRRRTPTPPRPPKEASAPSPPPKPAELNWMTALDDSDSDSEEDEEAAAQRAIAERRKRLEALAAKDNIKEPAPVEPESPPAPAPEPSPVKPAAPPPAVEKPAGSPPPARSVTPPAGVEFDVFGGGDTPINVQEDDRVRLLRDTAELEGREDLLNPLLTDNFIDKEGYYAFKAGEVLHRKYIVDGKYGSGVFSTVLKARTAAEDSREEDFDAVAIKVIRANDHMTKTGKKEVEIMKCLADADVKNRMHCLRYLDQFFHAKHLCVVLEPMECNLRDVLKKFGKTGGKLLGLSLPAVRSYTKQLCLSLSHLMQHGIVHADFKPDNILVSRNHSVLKLADFGSALYAHEVELTPYLVSRFYRAPEIMLGLPYGYGVDMWALGATAFELFTGRMMFPGRDNNAMLHLQQEVRGGLPKKLVRKAAFLEKHFNEDLTFVHLDVDPVTKQRRERERVYTQANASKSIKAQLEATVQELSYTTEQKQQLNHMRDFIEKTTMLDASVRFSADEALHHPFVVTMQTRHGW